MVLLVMSGPASAYRLTAAMVGGGDLTSLVWLLNTAWRGTLDTFRLIIIIIGVGSARHAVTLLIRIAESVPRNPACWVYWNAGSSTQPSAAG